MLVCSNPMTCRALQLLLAHPHCSRLHTVVVIPMRGCPPSVIFSHALDNVQMWQEATSELSGSIHRSFNNRLWRLHILILTVWCTSRDYIHNIQLIPKLYFQALFILGAPNVCIMGKKHLPTWFGSQTIKRISIKFTGQKYKLYDPSWIIK